MTQQNTFVAFTLKRPNKTINTLYYYNMIDIVEF